MTPRERDAEQLRLNLEYLGLPPMCNGPDPRCPDSRCAEHTCPQETELVETVYEFCKRTRRQRK